MKKLLLVIAVLAFVGTASAQKGDVRDKALTFGPKVGINITDFKLKGDNVDLDAGPKVDFQIGAFAEYRTNKWFAVSADLLYSRQGRMTDNTITVGSLSTNTKQNLTLQYFNIPVLANFYVAKGLALKTGLQAGFLLGAKMKTTTDGIGETSDVKDQINNFELAIPVGISYTFKFGLMLDARYNIAVTNSLKKEFRQDGVKSVRNDVFAISAGWKF